MRTFLVLVPLLSLALGVAVAVTGGQSLLHRGYDIELWRASVNYWAVACIAGIDTVCGGYRAGLEEKFRSDVFFTGFVSNILIAFLLAWLGDRIGVNLYLVAALVMGQRIFVNLSLIRRILLTRWQDRVARQKQKEEVAAQLLATNQSSETSRT